MARARKGKRNWWGRREAAGQRPGMGKGKRNVGEAGTVAGRRGAKRWMGAGSEAGKELGCEEQHAPAAAAATATNTTAALAVMGMALGGRSDQRRWR